MKKLICYFVLISSFLCGVGGASSSGVSKKDLERMGNREPRTFINSVFLHGAKDYDYRDETRLQSIADTIGFVYKDNKALQSRVIGLWAENIGYIKVNGKQKYTSQEQQHFVNVCKNRLNIK